MNVSSKLVLFVSHDCIANYTFFTRQEIQQARVEADEIMQREKEQTSTLKTERNRVAALKARDLIARLINRKSTMAV
ncbi:MAG: hypothetical protein ACI9LY_003872 [Arenicella sp.]